MSYHNSIISGHFTCWADLYPAVLASSSHPERALTQQWQGKTTLKGRNLERIAAFRWWVGGHPPEPEKGRRFGSTEARILKNENKLWQYSGYCNCNKQWCCDIISRIVPTGWHRFLQVYTSFYGPSRQKGPREKAAKLQERQHWIGTEWKKKKTILYYYLFFSPLERNKSLLFSSNLTKTNN